MFSRVALRSVRTALIQPPIQVYGVSGAYASAAYSAAVKADEKASVGADLANLSEICASNATIASFFNDPFADSAEKLNVVKSIAGDVGMSNVTVGLIETLAANNRMNLLEEVSEVFSRILRADDGEVPCSVESAIELTNQQKADVAESIAGLLGAGKHAVINSNVNPDLKGGMIVSIGDKYTEMKYIDMSVASKVKKYTELLRQGL
jgi:F-type H+-transporting ATPase subunit O